MDEPFTQEKWPCIYENEIPGPSLEWKEKEARFWQTNLKITVSVLDQMAVSEIFFFFFPFFFFFFLGGVWRC